MSLDKLDHDVAVKLASVDKSLTQVEEFRKHLRENAQKVKEEIHEAVERQVGTLRGRERQLVRQVEVVTAHQTCLLSTQQAGLMHSQGALTATKNLLHRCSPADVSTLSKIKMDELLCTRSVRPVNLVSVQLKESALNSAIVGFGSVQLPEAITHHPSPVIPAKVEEYEDDDHDHDVLHKSVAGAASGPDSPVRITVQFPRLNQQNWLIGQRERNYELGTSTKVVKDEDHHSKCDVTSWLSDLQLSGSHDEDDNVGTSSSIGSFDLVSNAIVSPVRTSESSSIEIVPSHFDSDKDDCSTMGSTCEIENLPSCFEDKSHWLSPKHTTSERLMLKEIKISEACQANELCSDFSDCLCHGNCADSALQKARQSAAYQAKIRRKRTISEAEGTDLVLAHMANILSSDNSMWLMKGRDNHSYLPTPAKKAMYESPGEKWLSHSSSATVVNPLQTPPRITLSTHSNIWLLHKLKAEKSKAKEEKDEADVEKSGDEEKESSRITNDDLSEALRRIKVDARYVVNSDSHCYTAKKSSGLTSEALRPLDGGQSWLLPKVGGNTSHPLDNKLQESEMSSKKHWLVFSNTTDPSMLQCGGKTSPLLPEPVLAVAEAGLNSWLMKRL